MRPDMDKVIVNRPRSGSRWMVSAFKKAKKFSVVQDEEGNWEYAGVLPENGKTSMKCRRWADWDHKSFEDHLQPLYRFVLKNCGRKWDDVYAEAVKGVDSRSVRGYHLRDHIEQYLNQKVRRFGGYDTTGEVSWWFYVDVDGILREKIRPNWKKDFKPKPPTHPLVKKGEKLFYKYPDGTWFEVWGRPFPSHKEIEAGAVAHLPAIPYADVLGFRLDVWRVPYYTRMWAPSQASRYVESSSVKTRYGMMILLEGKRTISKKEIKHYGLNAAPAQ